MQSLVVLGGLGDAYLSIALYDGFCRHYGRQDIELVIKSGHAAIAELFPGVRFRVDDAITFGTEADPAFQANHLNDLWTGQPFFIHPRMTRTRLSIDELPARPFICQADLFRIVLGLPLATPLSVPTVPWGIDPHLGTVVEPIAGTVMIVEANTWPNTQSGFYPKLIAALRASGRDVWVNDKAIPLRNLFARAAATEWVIGPQCGLISIFVTGRFPCRKTLATPSIDGGQAPQYWAPTTFPYAYVNRFAGEDFDVEEFKITGDHDGLISLILGGTNAVRLRPHDPNPIRSVAMPLTPGDFLDRFAVLTVKRARFSPERRAAIEREWQRHAEMAAGLLASSEVSASFQALLQHHGDAFDLLERAVPHALNGGMDPTDHALAIRMNRARVETKQEIDTRLRSGHTEVKSYY